MDTEFVEEPVSEGTEEAPVEEFQEEPVEDSSEEAPVEEEYQEEAEEPVSEEDSETDESEETEESKPFVVTINGKEVSMDENQAKVFIQAGYEAEEKLAQAEDIKNVVFGFLNELQTDPFKALSDPRLGIDLRDFAEKYLSPIYQREIEDETLSPEGKELRDLKEAKAREVKEAEKKRLEEEKRLNAEIEEEYKQKEIEYFGNVLVPELLKSGLPRTPDMLARVADMRNRTLDKGINVPPPVLIQKVKDSYMSEVRSVLESLEESALLDLLGDKGAAKFRKADVARFKNKGVVPNPVRKPDPIPGQTKQKKPEMSYKDFWKNLEKLGNKK